MSDVQGNPPRAKGGSIGFGVFLIAAGLALIAEKMGWLPNAGEWFFPVILMAWGASELYRRLA